MGLIDNFIAASGRVRKENGDIINQADFIDSEHDRLTGGVKSINTDHYYIHRGIAYKAYINLASVGATAVEYSFIAPAGTFPHFKNMQVTALGGTLRVTIRRGTTATPLSVNSPGAASDDIVGPNNLNDNTNRPTGVLIKKTPTYHDGKTGEVWFQIQVVGDSTNQFTSVAEISSNDNEEIVMKPETYYVIRLERIGNDSPANVALTLFWYEEPQGLLG